MSFRKLVRAAGDSLWRELGEEVLKSAIDVLVEEGIEAAVEIWKKRKLKIQEEELENRDLASDGSESGSGGGDGSKVGVMDADAAESDAERREPSGSVDPAETGRTSPNIEPLSDYVDRHTPGSG